MPRRYTNPILFATLFGGGAAVLLYGDEFTGTVAAPIPAGNADVKGYRVVNDVESKMSIGSGVLAVDAQATAVWGDEYYRAQPSSGQQYWTRPAGKALVAVTAFNHSVRNAQAPCGWWATATLDANAKLAVQTASSAMRVLRTNATLSDTIPYAASTDIYSISVWTSTGVGTFSKVAGVWQRQWEIQEALTQMYCGMSNFNSAGSLKYFRIYAVDESVFAPALSIANPSVGNLADMPDGDFLLYLDNITRPSASALNIRFRKKNTLDFWRDTITNAGAFTLDEVISGANTNRIVSSGVVSTDDIITIARAQTIQAWRNTTALGSAYTAAYNFLRETGLELNSLGTGGAIGTLMAWKARLLNEAGFGSELVVNGGFDTDTNWVKGTGWTISGGTANKVAGTLSNLNPLVTILTVGKYYELSFTITNFTAGTLTPYIGGSTALAPISANGTYTYKSICTGAVNIYFQGDASFVGSIDNVSVKEIQFTADELALVLDRLTA